LRYRLNGKRLAGRPDIVFPSRRVVVFVDGDFWHGRDWRRRRQKLAQGHNAEYWVAKIRGNIERDRRQTRALEREGWTVLRFWESDIQRDTAGIAEQIRGLVRAVSTDQ
jgi:DNA mismatch endonuclease (patch repair protein)